MSDLQGRIEGDIHRLQVRVYYEDTDFSGNVYHANYLKYCERARSDFVRCLGIDQNAMKDSPDGTFFVVRHVVCDFLRPARFDDILTVETPPAEMTGVRMRLKQRVLRGDEVLFTADVTAVIVDNRGRPKRMPPDMLALFTPPFP
jgi:acyl-CoA thioester hydrolase